MKTKVCAKCKIEKPIEEISKSKSKRSGYSSYCKECYRERARLTRSKATQQDKELHNLYKRRKSIENKMESIKYKGGKCEDCGIIANTNNRSIFDFHHTDPSIKEGGVRFDRCFERRKQELDKCILLCSNCHKLRHQHYNDGLRETL